MKKIVAILLVLAFVLSLSGCGEKEKTPLEKARDRAVSIGQSFLDFEITAEEARTQLDSIAVPDRHGEGRYLSIRISLLSYQLIDGLHDLDYEKIADTIESIKKINFK